MFSVQLIQRILLLIIIIFLAPIFIILGLLVLFDTKKFPIFSQERGLTLEKHRFKIFKFRTFKNEVVNYSENDSRKILSNSHKVSQISNFGKFLRKSGLDELPQLINVLMGQMNLIGPRPLSIEDLGKIKKYYPELYFRRSRLNSKPGIIGLWQLNKDDEFSIQHLVQMDEIFERENSLMLKTKIITKGLKALLIGDHRDSIVNGDKLSVYPISVYILSIFLFILLSLIFINLV